MVRKKYTLNIRNTGDGHQVDIPEITATATGATFDDAVDAGNLAIIEHLKATRPARKPRKRAQQQQQHTTKAS